MLQINGRVRGLALLSGGVVAASTFLAPAPVKADKSDTIKAGAAVLGGAAAVLAAKGKTVPAIIAGAAGYYAYKKGRDEDRKKNDYPYYGQSTQYPTYPGTNYPSNYPTYGNYPSNSPTYGTYPTDNYPTYNYPSNNYPTYSNTPTYSNYPSGYSTGSYGGNNNCHEGNRNTGYNGNYNGSYGGGYNGGHQGGYNGSYNNGYDRYPNSYSAAAPKAAATATRSNQKVVLR